MSSIFDQRKGEIHYFYVHVAVGGNTFSIINFQRGGRIIHWGGRGTMGIFGAVARSRTTTLYVVDIIFWPGRGNIGIHVCGETIDN